MEFWKEFKSEKEAQKCSCGARVYSVYFGYVFKAFTFEFVSLTLLPFHREQS